MRAKHAPSKRCFQQYGVRLCDHHGPFSSCCCVRRPSHHSVAWTPRPGVNAILATSSHTFTHLRAAMGTMRLERAKFVIYLVGAWHAWRGARASSGLDVALSHALSTHCAVPVAAVYLFSLPPVYQTFMTMVRSR